MNYEDNTIKIIVYALACAFFLKTETMPIIRSFLLTRLRTYWYKKYKEFNNRYDKIKNRIITPFRPFDCLGCMTFWSSIALNYSLHYRHDYIPVGIVGFFVGSIVEGIMMRWL